MANDSVPVPIKYTARDFAAIKADLSEFIKATRPDDWSDFFASSLGTALIDLLAYVGDILSYGQDVTAQELFLATARRYESVLRFCRSVGYVPRSAVSSKCVLRAIELPPAVSATGAVIDAGTFITGLNGLHYEVVDQVIIPPGATEWLFPVQEGQSYSETFQQTRAGRQEFTTSKGVVEHNSWKVYIGDPNDVNNLWTQVSNVSLEISPTKTYEVYFDGDGKAHFIFGDGNAGKIPDAVPTIKYRTCNGEDGNASLSTIKGSLKATLVGSGTSISIDAENLDQASVGGRNRETVPELRVSVPAFIRTLDKLVTLRDYEETLRRIADVALGYADVPLASYSGNIVRSYAWAAENIDFTVASTVNGLSSTVGYRRYIQLPASRVQAIQQFLSPRSIVTVHNIVMRPTIAWVDIDLGTVLYNRLLKIQDVHRGIVEAIVGVFENSTGFQIRVGDIYAAVMKVPGVLGFQLKKIVFEHLDPTNSAVTLTDDMRQDQDPTGANGGPYLALGDISTPAAVRRQFYDASYLYDGEIRYAGEVDSSSVQAINLRSLSFNLQS